jgi:hypothetical protein
MAKFGGVNYTCSENAGKLGTEGEECHEGHNLIGQVPQAELADETVVEDCGHFVSFRDRIAVLK